jgi:acetyltransferase
MSIQSLLNPKTVAIVGASEKVGPGFNAFKALEFVGFEGEIFLVNPRSPELFGRKTFASLGDIPGKVDAVFIAVAAEAVLEIAKQAVAKGAGALTILSSGFGETEEGKGAQRELVEIAEKSDMAVCGPNCLGLLNFSGRTALFGTSLPDRVERGGVAAIAQSGSVGIALLNSARGLGFSHVITSGNEAVTTAADYIDALVNDPDVTTILVFAEQIKKPAAFMQALRRARDAQKPVIVLKSGRSQSGKAAVMAHTGAIAGSEEAADAALLAAGAIQVFSLDDLIETSLLASKIKTKPNGPQLGGVSLSGGEIALVLDAAEEVGAMFAPLESALPKLKQLLPPYAHLANPLDLTWVGLYDPAVGQACAEAVASQPDVGMLVLFQDAPSGLGLQQATRYSKLLEAVGNGAAAAKTPAVALSNISDQPHHALQAVADGLNIPYLRGTRAGLSAISRYVKWSSAISAPEIASSSAEISSAKSELDRIPSHRLPAEHEAREALKSYGVTGPREEFVASPKDAASAASDIGYPVVLKGVVENLVHKSDAGLVKVGLSSAAEVERAAEKMQAAAAKLPSGKFFGFLVQRKVSPVGEIFVGAKDSEFGPLVIVGAGGVQVELYKDVAIRLAPIDEESAREAIASTRIAKLLGGFRGAPAGDVRAAARTVSALSRFMTDFADRVAEVEINPLAVLAEGHGCIALDCVVIPKNCAR